LESASFSARSCANLGASFGNADPSPYAINSVIPPWLDRILTDSDAATVVPSKDVLPAKPAGSVADCSMFLTVFCGMEDCLTELLEQAAKNGIVNSENKNNVDLKLTIRIKELNLVFIRISIISNYSLLTAKEMRKKSAIRHSRKLLVGISALSPTRCPTTNFGHDGVFFKKHYFFRVYLAFANDFCFLPAESRSVFENWIRSSLF
jgi:hypothetical protein